MTHSTMEYEGDRRVVNLRQRFVELSAALEAAPDDEAATALLVAEYYALKPAQCTRLDIQ